MSDLQTDVIEYRSYCGRSKLLEFGFDGARRSSLRRLWEVAKLYMCLVRMNLDNSTLRPLAHLWPFEASLVDSLAQLYTRVVSFHIQLKPNV